MLRILNKKRLEEKKIFVLNPEQLIIKDKLLDLQKNLTLDFGSFLDEFSEQMMAVRYLKGDEKVLEIGGNIGRNSLIIASILNKNNNNNFVSLECDYDICNQLKHNKEKNKLNFYIENSALSKRNLIQKGWNTVVSDKVLVGYKPVNIISWEELNNKYNINFDTLILDCEGAFYYILIDMPEILNNIKLIVMENDYWDITKYNYVNKNIIEDNEDYLKNNEIFNIVEPFLCKNIILEKSENILYELNKPTFEQVVFTYENEDISIMNGYHTIIKIDNEYRLYFRSSNNLEFKYYTTEDSANYENFCLITSDDGLTFKKNKKELFKNLFCHNFFPYYSSQQNKFIGISGTGMFQKGIYLFESNDGLNWDKKEKIIEENMICNNWTHPNHFDSLNCLVYNDIDKFYYIYMRHNNRYPLRRFVQFSKTRDFVKFTKCKLINIINDDKTQIYISGIFKYFNSNYFLSIPTLHINDKAIKNLMISDNNVDWVIIDNNLISDDKPRYIVHGMVPSLDNKKIYFYTFDEPDIKNSYLSCYSYPIHRINKIYCKDEGFIKTKIINLLNSSMTINLETNENGYIIVEIYDQANNIILKSNKLIGNEFNLIVNWEGETILEKNNYYVKFIINNAYLYSFTYNIK